MRILQLSSWSIIDQSGLSEWFDRSEWSRWCRMSKLSTWSIGPSGPSGQGGTDGKWKVLQYSQGLKVSGSQGLRVSRSQGLSHLSYEVSTIIHGMLESSGFRKYSTPVVFQLFYRRLCLCLCLCHCLCLCLCLCICISVWIWIADVMSFQKMYGLRGPWGQTAVLQLTYELRPKWNNNKQQEQQDQDQDIKCRF